MACLSTIEAALLAYRAILVTLFLFSRATNVRDMALLAALRTFTILLRTVVTDMVGATAALARFGSCAIRHCMASLTAIVALLLADRTLLLLFDRLIGRTALFF